MKTKQTAVEFLLKELINNFEEEMQNIYLKNMHLVASICEQAKEMEKKQRLEKYSERFNNDESAIGNQNTLGKRIVEEPKQEKLDCPFDFTSRCTMGRCDCKPKQKNT